MWTRNRELSFDFDESSTEWKRNKISQGNGTYAYKCCAIKRDGNTCDKKRYNDDYCKQHMNSNKIEAKKKRKI